MPESKETGLPEPCGSHLSGFGEHAFDPEDTNTSIILLMY